VSCVIRVTLLWGKLEIPCVVGKILKHISCKNINIDFFFIFTVVGFQFVDKLAGATERLNLKKVFVISDGRSSCLSIYLYLIFYTQ